MFAEDLSELRNDLGEHTVLFEMGVCVLMEFFSRRQGLSRLCGSAARTEVSRNGKEEDEEEEAPTDGRSTSF